MMVVFDPAQVNYPDLLRISFSVAALALYPQAKRVAMTNVQ